jgi:outer membrane protein assembly factor BamB
MQADTGEGVFEYFACQCSGPINALAADSQRLFAVDDFGQLLVFDVANGAMQALFAPGVGQINALAAAGGSVFAGTEEGLVARIDPLTGEVLSSRNAPAGVRALLAHGGFLFAGGSDGAVYRAPVAGGEFEYFTCFCFWNIQAMVMEGGHLVIVDENGIVVRVDVETGQLLTGFFVGQTNSMAATGGKLLFYYAGAGGAIPMVDAQTGAALPGGFKSPIDVRTMLVIPEQRPKHTQRITTPRLRTLVD